MRIMREAGPVQPELSGLLCEAGNLDQTGEASSSVNAGINRMVQKRPEPGGRTEPRARKAGTCKVCRAKFDRVNPLQQVCSPACAITLATKKREAADKKAKAVDRKVTREKLEKLKTRREYIKEAQIAFNAYIRERDKNQPCICCGLPLGEGDAGGKYDCGHYRSVGSAPHLRFDERNAHAQRKQCNRWGSGRAVDYRIGLIGRIGLEALESLESDQSVQKLTIEDAKRIKSLYKEKLKSLKGAEC